MSFGAIYLLSHRTLKWLSIGMGLFFVALAIWLRFTTELKAGETHLVLLIPLIWGVALVVSGLFLSQELLKIFYFVTLIALPVLFTVVNSIGCRAHWFSATWCS
jgi:hypothetical protein